MKIRSAHLSDPRVEAILAERQKVTGTLVRKRFLTAMPSVKRDYTYHGPRFDVRGVVYYHALRAFDPNATVPTHDGPYAKEPFSFEYPQQIVAAERQSFDQGQVKLVFGDTIPSTWR